MKKLRLSDLPADKPEKVTIELPSGVHRDLLAYAEVLSQESGRPVSDPSKLIVPMIQRFMATDREFARRRRLNAAGSSPTSE
ncbi:DUF2274 domain-containing protein [Rhizobium sp. CNPSo 4039]|uniref:DUF2274 domain-containing protein n=1 Tax=Rhizobium sp. CNPSo 4039 TaxID=3021409 RepID=UPI00254AF61D|nr:DUF2274 domain-containing protein [Rhizobium sp. CNPSo 4039]MDK4713240.1 DUF2274 domain-containing protein [Rhizobium sp. CNPSo 4039]